MKLNTMYQNFTYMAVDSRGKKHHGSIESESRDAAILALKKQGLYATSMDSGIDPKVQADSEGLQSILDIFGFTMVSQKDMSVYTRKFAGLLNAGIDWSNIFDILSEETENARLRRISTKIAADLRQGKNVTETLAKYPNVFTKVYRSMIGAGEATGRLDEILNRLADMYEQEHELRTSMMSKLYFPIIYLIVALLIIAAVIFILPRFITTLYTIFPLSLFISVVMFWGTMAALALLARTKPGYRIFRSLIAYIPPFNGVLRKMSLGRFSRLLAAMYSSGVDILTGLDIAGETLMEPDLQAGVKRVKYEINNGTDLASAMKNSNVFPRSLRGMVRTGEIAGDIEGMLDKAADYYELDVKGKTSMLAALFTVLGLVIVLVTIAIFIISAWSGYYGFIDEFMNDM
ncbi:MAG: type II secretion system F family protein [bacterium]